ncbi:MarR family transcriptional regulator [Helicobacter sp. 11S03491-1]|uniref:MarR family winged helix-turn-helix transcriptional regulator n=1 Tax=Helicobacter sp. 11S03491-1 TaxID=1476196 RepID=UPI000BA55B30|nr:MarR family transcriptional regulator [Helicobacter sp. 11S03491-1]PAF41080.1 hypothetical protein BKH45_08370 [Helicobacter sp. 11S03491-1]
MQRKCCKEKEVVPSIIFASRQIKNFFSAKLQPYNIGVEQIGILFILKESGALNITDLSNITLKDKGTISRTIKCLCKKNLVKKIQEKEDNRIAKIIITPEGIEKVELIKNNKKTLEDAFANSISHAEKIEFIRILDKITAAMS